MENELKELKYTSFLNNIDVSSFNKKVILQKVIHHDEPGSKNVTLLEKLVPRLTPVFSIFFSISLLAVSIYFFVPSISSGDNIERNSGSNMISISETGIKSIIEKTTYDGQVITIKYRMESDKEIRDFNPKQISFWVGKQIGYRSDHGKISIADKSVEGVFKVKVFEPLPDNFKMNLYYMAQVNGEYNNWEYEFPVTMSK